MLKVTWQELESAELIPFKDMQPGDIVVPMNWVVESVEVVDYGVLVFFTESGVSKSCAFLYEMGAGVVRR